MQKVFSAGSEVAPATSGWYRRSWGLHRWNFTSTCSPCGTQSGGSYDEQLNFPFKLARGKCITLLLLCLFCHFKMRTALLGQSSNCDTHNNLCGDFMKKLKAWQKTG